MVFEARVAERSVGNEKKVITFGGKKPSVHKMQNVPGNKKVSGHVFISRVDLFCMFCK
jgi:uncharacterized protein (UPF0128 family)